MAGTGFFWVLFSPVGVGVAGTCDPHVGGTLATEGCCALVESLVLDPKPALYLLFCKGSPWDPRWSLEFLGFLGKNA